MRVLRNLDNLPDFQKAVLTIGSFDGVHLGHQKLIERINHIAREIDGESIVVTFHPHPRSIIYPKDKSLRLLNTLDEKLELFRKYSVDNVVIVPFTIEFSQISAREYIENFIIGRFKPSCLVIGYDHRFGLNRAGDLHLLKDYSAKGFFQLFEISKREIDDITVSSSKIRTALQEGDLNLANSLSNHNYRLKGIVEHGNKIGTKLGFPTANLRVSESTKLIPKEGIYAVKVFLESESFFGMLYIGRRPTVSADQELAIEVNLFEFNDNIYNKELELELISFIREDQKFESLDELKNQLSLDEMATKNFFDSYPETTSNNKTAIAILNYNGLNHLESYLASVSFSSSDEFDFYVIDNASTDKSISYINEWFPEIKLIELLKNHGFAGGYNRGIDHINNKYVVILNSDVMVKQGWLDPLIKLLDEDESIAAVMPKILSLENQSQFEYAGACGGYIDNLGYPFCRGRIFEDCEEDENQYENEEEVFWTSGAAMVIRTQIFKKLGGFDADYFAHMEEIDLCWRINRAGYIMKVCPDSTVFHLGGGTLSYDSSKKVELNFRNNLFTIFKNEPFLKLMWLLPLRLILDLLAGIKFIIEGKPENLIPVMKAHFLLYRNLRLLHKKRKSYNAKIQSILIGPQTMTGKFNGSIIWQYFVLGKKKFSEIKFK